MRDVETLTRIARAEKRAAMAQRHVGFLDFRTQAIEAVLLSASAWSLLFGRAKLLKRIDDLQLAMMAKHDEDMRKQVEEAQKPKVILPENRIQVVR